MAYDKYEKIVKNQIYYKDIVRKEFKRYRENKYPDILVLGRSVSGKSTLIEAVFKKKIIKACDDNSEIKDFKIYLGRDNNSYLNIIDSDEYEIGNNNLVKYTEAINRKAGLREGAKSNIDLVWLSISVAENKIDDIDLYILNTVCKMEKIKNKFCVVLTGCDKNRSLAEKFKKALAGKAGEDNINIFEVFNDSSLTSDLEDLVVKSSEIIKDEDLKTQFISAQMVNICEKKKEAKKIIEKSVADEQNDYEPIINTKCELLLPSKLVMASKIVNIYGLQNINMFSPEIAPDKLLIEIAENFVTADYDVMMAFINWMGGGFSINKELASLLTRATGLAVSELCYKICKKTIKGESIGGDNIFDSHEFGSLFEAFSLNRKSMDEY